MVTTSTGVSTLLGWNRSVKRSELPVPFHHQKGTLTDGRFLGPGSSTLVAGLLECRAFHKATHFCSVWFRPNGPLQSLAANMEYQAVQKRYQAIPAWVVWKWGVPGMPPLNGNMNKKSMYLIFKQTQVVAEMVLRQITGKLYHFLKWNQGCLWGVKNWNFKPESWFKVGLYISNSSACWVMLNRIVL